LTQFIQLLDPIPELRVPLRESIPNGDFNLDIAQVRQYLLPGRVVPKENHLGTMGTIDERMKHGISQESGEVVDRWRVLKELLGKKKIVRLAENDS